MMTRLCHGFLDCLMDFGVGNAKFAAHMPDMHACKIDRSIYCNLTLEHKQSDWSDLCLLGCSLWVVIQTKTLQVCHTTQLASTVSTSIHGYAELNCTKPSSWLVHLHSFAPTCSTCDDESHAAHHSASSNCMHLQSSGMNE